MLDMSSIINTKSIIIYLVIINIVTFIVMGIDKNRAKKKKWRISEGALLTLAVLGGSIGGIAGMYTFRHKTQKKRFSIGFPLILIIEILIFMFYKFF